MLDGIANPLDQQLGVHLPALPLKITADLVPDAVVYSLRLVLQFAFALGKAKARDQDHCQKSHPEPVHADSPRRLSHAFPGRNASVARAAEHRTVAPCWTRLTHSHLLGIFYSCPDDLRSMPGCIDRKSVV